MTDFKCPNCSKHSNKFYSKCPDCGYERLQGKDIKIGNGDTTNKRKLARERSLTDSKFRGGRNQTLIGDSRKRNSKKGDK